MSFSQHADYLGSVRAVVDFDGSLLETSDFLPYGTRWSQTVGSAAGTLADATNRWRYSGKEEQAAALNPALPLIDYGARMYDPAIARWMSVDPLAEKYYPMGGYGYCAGSPVNLIDPDGRIVRLANNYAGGIENIAKIAATSLGSRVMSHLIRQKDVLCFKFNFLDCK